MLTNKRTDTHTHPQTDATENNAPRYAIGVRVEGSSRRGQGQVELETTCCSELVKRRKKNRTN